VEGARIAKHAENADSLLLLPGDRLALIVECRTDEFGFGAEIQQKTNLIGSRAQVVQQPSFVVSKEAGDGFQFHDDRFLHQEVGELFTDDLPLIVHSNFNISPNLQSRGVYRNLHGVLIDFLQKSIPQPGVHNLEDRLQNFISYISMLEPNLIVH
jgi:hypothetical protein